MSSPQIPKDDYRPSLPNDLKPKEIKEAEPILQKGWWDTFSFGATLATQGVKTLYNTVTSKTEDKEKIIANANNIILEKLDDVNGPLFVQLSTLIGDLSAKGALKGAEGQIGSYGSHYLNYALDIGPLTKAFVSQAFANLASNIRADSHNIPNYENQPVLLSLLSVLVKNSSVHLNREALSNIEGKYSQDIYAFQTLIKAFYPNSEDREYVQDKMQEYIKSNSTVERKEILNEIFSEYYAGKEDETQIADTKKFLAHLDNLDKRHQEMSNLFNEFANDLLLYIFPEKYNDPSIQTFIKGEVLFDTIYSGVQSKIAETLLTEYDSIEMSSFKNEIDPSLKPLVAAPSKLLTEVSKNFIQFNPAAVSLVNGVVYDIVHPADPESKPLTTDQKQELISQEPELVNLSHWLLESLQAGTRTDDSQFEGVLNYAREKIEILTEKTLSKGLSSLDPEGEIKNDQVIQKIVDNLSLKLESRDNEDLIKGLPKFIQDLPIPITAKTQMLSKINDLKDYELRLKKIADNVDTLHGESIKKILSYKGGNELLSFAESLTNQMMESVQGSDLTTKAEFNQKLQELLDEFLPGLKIDDELKKVLKNNFSTLKSGEISNLTKKGIQTMLCIGISGAIDDNFDPNLNCADQFFNKIMTSFKEATTSLTASDSIQLSNALKIQSQIEVEKQKIQELKKNLLPTPLGAPDLMQTAFDEALLAANRLVSAKARVENLSGQLNEIENTIPKNSKLISDASSIEFTIKSAKKAVAEREKVYLAKRNVFEDLDGKTDAQESFKQLKQWLELSFAKREEINDSTLKILKLEKELDKNLDVYKTLSKDFASFIGLNANNKGKLPSFLQDNAWPLFEDAVNTVVPRLFFEGTAPIISSMQELQVNKDKLIANNPLVVKIVERASNQVIDEIPSHMNSDAVISWLKEANPALSILGDRTAKALTITENSQFLKDLIQGSLFKIFVRIGAENQNIFSLVSESLKNLNLAKGVIQPKSSVEIAHFVINKVLEDVLKIKSENDLTSLPFPLRKEAYDQIKKLSLEYLTPLVLPIIEKDAVKQELDEVSGSPFLSQIGEALTNDIFTHMPELIKSLTPLSIADQIKGLNPLFDDELTKLIADELEKTINKDHVPYQNIQEPIKAFINAHLFNFFLSIAEKNPAADGKDSMMVLTEKLLALSAQKFTDLKTKPFADVARDVESSIMEHNTFGIPEALEKLPPFLSEKVNAMIKGKIEQSLITLQLSLTVPENSVPNNSLIALTDLLANKVAKNVVDDLPAILLKKAGDGKLQMVNQMSSALDRNLEDLAIRNFQIANVLLSYAEAPQLGGLVENQLNQIAGIENPAKEMAAKLIGHIIADPLDRAVKISVEFEKKHASFDQKLMVNILQVAAGHFEMINGAKENAKKAGRDGIFHGDFVKAAGVNLHPAVPKTIPDFQKSIDAIYAKLEIESMPQGKKEELQKAIFSLVQDEKLNGLPMTNDRISEKLIPILFGSVPKLSKVYADKLSSFDKDTKSLKTIILEEMNTPNLQRKKEFYTPLSKPLLKMLFPNGKNDLTFIPEAGRAQTWKLFKQNLPEILPIIIGSILDPVTINNMVLNILESTRDNLDKDIDLDAPTRKANEIANLPLSELDDAAASLMKQIMKGMDLPPLVKDIIIDPKTGDISESNKKMIGDVLRAQLNGSFIEDNLRLIFVSVIEGKPIEIDTRSRAEIAIEQRQVIEPKIRKTARQVVDSGISNLVRTKWASAQRDFDSFVKSTFGTIGTGLKKALDAVFRFVFFKVIGTIISWTLFPVVKKIIYNYVSLDKNVDALLDPLRRIPKDQNDLEAYAVYNENLIFKLVDGMQKSIEEVLNNEMRFEREDSESERSDAKS